MIEILNITATLIIGLYAGSLLTEAVILVPYWRKLAPENFIELHGTLGPYLFRYFAPLTVASVILALAVPLFDQARTLMWIVCAGLCFTALIIFFLYFKKANARFADHTISEAELPGELVKWARWHWVRTVLIIIALGTSIAGHASVRGI